MLGDATTVLAKERANRGKFLEMARSNPAIFDMAKVERYCADPLGDPRSAYELRARAIACGAMPPPAAHSTPQGDECPVV